MKRLILLGGGHAHLHVVRAFGARPLAGARVTLVDRDRQFHYSGMLPGLLAGHYRPDECRVDLAALCARSGVDFVHEEAVALDRERRRIATASGRAYLYDILSIDTGSTPPLQALPGATEHALAVKPIAALLHEIERRLDAGGFDANSPIAVVGGGAGGFELALALEHRMRTRHGVRNASVRLVADTAAILPGLPSRARALAERRLCEQGIALHTGDAVRAVSAAALELASGRRLPAALTLLATGAHASPVYEAAGLDTDAAGCVRVAASLRALSDPCVFASGDAAAFVDRPLPKSGVYAVRQGPLLALNLRRALSGGTLERFEPQRTVLVLLSTGRKHAIAVRNRVTLHGRWVWHWKDGIDRRFLARFRAIARRSHGTDG